MKKMIPLWLCGFVISLFFFSVFAHAQTSFHFKLQGPDGVTYTQESFPGKYTLLAFGYTHCPDVCPTTLYTMKRMLNQYPEPEQIQPIFITIDPSRDTLELLNQYVSYFNPRILGLSGDRAAIDDAVTVFQASYGYQIDGKKVDPDTIASLDDYEVYHSTYLYLLDDQGNLLDIYDYQISPEALNNGVEKAIAEHRAN